MHINMTRAELDTRGGILDELMDKGFAASGLVDAAGRLIRYSAPTLRDLGLTDETSVGHMVTELDPSTHLARVAQTGVSETGRLTLMHGKYHIINEIPIYDGEERIGAMGMLTSYDSKKLKHALSALGGEDTGLYNSLSRSSSAYTFNDYVGEHPSVREVLDQCRLAAASAYPVLITGETGTGKEILAGAIHAAAHPAASAPYVKLNCTAIPDNLLESELFGHEKGAFTGAVTSKKGKFELAGGGTILLDEIGEMDLRMQSKLLRVLEEREFERLGGTRMLSMNARVIASTNANLPRQCVRKEFRSDLYYRLSTIEIAVPPLRERRSDIPRLVAHFIDQEGMSIRFSPDAMERMVQYAWPGNVRQLRNIVTRLGLIAPGQIIDGARVKQVLHGTEPPPDEGEARPAAEPEPASIQEAEREAILSALRACGSNQTEAARRLGIGRTTLYRKMHKYGITAKRALDEGSFS